MIDNFYNEYMYTPMPEMHSEMIPVTQGCSYNKCLYCDLNYKQKFKVFEFEDIKTYIESRRRFYQDKRVKPTKFNLLEGNPLCLDTDFLLRIMKEINKNFSCKYISMFARVKDVLNKSEKDLLRLKNEKMDRICLGLESGSDKVLAFHNKGTNLEDSLKACKKLERLGIKYSAYIMLGLGGRDLSKDHIEKTAFLLNQIHPFEIVIVTTVIFKRAGLAQKVRSKEFKRLSVRESILEERDLLEKLELETIFNASHKTNALILTGLIPDHKKKLLDKIDSHLEEYSKKDLVKLENKKWRVWDKE